MVTLVLYVALNAAFGFIGGCALRSLRRPEGEGRSIGQRWAIYVGFLVLGLAFARFVLNRDGLFGPQPESTIFVGVVIMLAAFLFASGALSRFK